MKKKLGEIIPINLWLCLHFLRTFLTWIIILILFSIYGPENCIFPPKYYLHIIRLGMKINYLIFLNYINLYFLWFFLFLGELLWWLFLQVYIETHYSTGLWRGARLSYLIVMRHRKPCSTLLHYTGHVNLLYNWETWTSES